LIPEIILDKAEETWPGIQRDKFKSDCEECPDRENCPWAFDLYNIYTEDGQVARTGPLCLK